MFIINIYIYNNSQYFKKKIIFEQPPQVNTILASVVVQVDSALACGACEWC